MFRPIPIILAALLTVAPAAAEEGVLSAPEAKALAGRGRAILIDIRFRIRTASRDEKRCAWLKLGIVPPHAPASRKPTPVLCAPASARVGGWACRFGKP